MRSLINCGIDPAVGRGDGVAAPLKENLGAALLLRCGWADLATNGAAFLDPMCGSGTLAIEAALIAANIAPGLSRDWYGFMGWVGHDAALFESLREQARLAIDRRALVPGRIVGSDRDPRGLRAGRQSLAH